MPFDLGVFDLTPFDVGRLIRPPSPEIATEIPQWFSTAINQSPGSNIHKIMQVIVARCDELRNTHRNLIRSRWISTAIGDALDAIADGYGISRLPGEADATFRRRIPVMILIGQSSGTIADIQRAVAYMLDMSAAEVVILERYRKYPLACFTVRLTDQPHTAIPWQDVDAMIQLIRAAGVYYESAGYDITPAWVTGQAGWGNTAKWGTDWY